MNIRQAFLTTAAASCVIVGASAAGATDLITNGNFESPTNSGVNIFDVGSTGLTGWTVVGPGGANIAQQANGVGGITAPGSTQYLDLTGTNDGSGLYGGVSQLINTTAGQNYVLTFDVGNYSNQTSQVGVTAQAGSTSNTFSVNAPLSGYNWVSESLPFTATSSSTEITLTGTAGYYYTGLADVSISGVPEPATWAMMLFGLGSLGAVLRAHRRANSDLASHKA